MPVGRFKMPFRARCLLTSAALFSTPGQTVHHRTHHSVFHSEKTTLVLLREVVRDVLCFAPEHQLPRIPRIEKGVK